MDWKDLSTPQPFSPLTQPLPPAGRPSLFDLEPQPISLVGASSPTEVIVVDPGVTDYQVLLHGLTPNQHVLLLDADQDGIVQISNFLATQTQVSALHVLSHGSAGQVALGSTVLNADTVGDYQTALSGWARSLTTEADILFYGCEVASGVQGQALTQLLSQVTGADIAASTDRTGSAALDGDWEFEWQSGPIEAKLAFGAGAIAAYGGVLAGIGNAQRDALNAGLQALTNWANTSFDAASALAQPLPMVLDTTNPSNPVSATLAQVLDLSTLLTDRLQNPASSYLAGGTLTTEGLRDALNAIPGITATDVSAGGELRLKVQLQAANTQNLAFDLGRNADVYGLNFATGTSLALTRQLDFNFSFGINASNQFFIRLNEAGDGLTAKADIHATNLNLQGQVGFLGIGITNGSVDLDADVAVTFTNPDSDAAGQITTGELTAFTLTPTGALNAQLPVTVSGGFFTPTGTPTITVTADPFSASIRPTPGFPDLRTAPTLALTDFSSLLDFTSLTPESVKGLLLQLGNSFGDLDNTSVFKTAIPFTDGKTLGQVMDLGAAFAQRLEALLTNPDGSLRFKTAQELNTILGSITNGALAYNAATKELTYQVAFSQAAAATTPSVALNLDLSPLSQVVIGASAATLNGSASLDFDFGFDLDPSAGPLAIAGRLQASDEPNPGQPLTPANGRLSSDAHFTLTIGNNPPMTVTVAADATNASIADLVADVQAAVTTAITTAGLGVTVTVAQTGGRIVLSTSDAALLRIGIATGSDTAATELGFQDNQIARARTETLFINNASINGSVALAVTDLDASATFGFLSIGTNNGTGSVTGNVALSLSDPGTVANDGRIDLKEFFDGLSNPAQLSSLVGTPTVTGNGTLSLNTIRATPDIFNLNSSLGAGNPAIVISLGSLTDLSTLTVTPNADAAALLNFDNLTFDKVTLALDAIATFLQGASLPFLNQPLPLINQSLGSLVDTISRFKTAADDLKANPAGAIQLLQQRLREALGLPSDSPLVALSLDGGNVLKLSLEVGVGYSGALPINFDLGSSLGSLAGAANLVTDANGVLRLDIGIDLNTPDNVFLYDSTQLRLEARAGGTNLNFTGAVGPLGLSIVNGTAMLDADGNPATTNPLVLTIDLPDDLTDHRYTLGELAGLSFQRSLTGQVTANLPVFFPTASNFIGTIGLSVTDLTDPVGSTSLTLPNLTDLIANFSLLDNLGLVVDGLDSLLSSLQSVLDNQVFNRSLPLIGTRLSDGAQFIENFRQTVVNRIQAALDNTPQQAAAIVQTALFEALGPAGLGLLLDGSDAGTDVGLSDIGMVATANQVDWQMRLGSPTQTVTVPLDFDIGLPGLGMDINSGIRLNLGWEFDFGFGLNRTNGFYFDTAKTNELAVLFDVSLLPPGTAKGSLGFLQLDATDAGTGFSGSFAIDFTDSADADSRLTLAELSSLGVTANLGARADIALDLLASFGGKAAFPSIATDLRFGWGFGSQIDGAHPAEPILAFNNVRMNLGEFISQFAGPLLQEIQDILAPFNKPIVGGKSILEILTTPIPVLSDLAGSPITLLGLAKTLSNNFAPGTEAFIDAVLAINDLVNTLGSAPTGNIPIVFGSFSVGGNQLFSNIGGTSALTPSTNPLGSNWKDQILGSSAGGNPYVTKLLGQVTNSDASLTFPFLESPNEVFGLLLGKPAVLLAYDLPRLGFDFSYSQFFPIWGPLGARITGKIGAGADFAFGYDTAGLQTFAQNGFRTPLDIFRGFYVSDRINANGTGEDVPEIVLNASLTAGVELNAVVASAGVEGGLFAEIALNLDDPNNDGRVRLEELFNNFVLGVNYFETVVGTPANFALAPLALFDTSGELTARLYAFVEALFGLYRKEFNITPPITLLRFDYSVPRPPVLASLVDEANGVLRLNMGPYAGDRLHGDTRDLAEHFVVRQGSSPDTVLVSAPSLGVGEQEYKGVKHILADGGQESDRIDLSGVTNAAITAELRGGFGNDTLIAGAGRATLYGGAGNDELIGGNSADVMVGNEGNDTIDGQGGDDWIFGDNGTIAPNRYLRSFAAATDGNDTITGGAGNDLIFGGGGADRIGGDVAWTVLDGGGSVANSSDVIFGDGGRVVLSGSTPDLNQIDATTQGVGGADIIRAHNGNDRVYGGAGNDTIAAGADQDQVWGELGNDQIDGQAGNDTLNGGAGDDTVVGGLGNDSILGENGNDSLRGGADDDTLYGGRGADTMFGDAGRDRMFGESDGDLMYGGDGDDYMEGNAGNDTLAGELNNDEIYGGAGDDIAFGDFGEVDLLLDGDPLTRDRIRSINPALGGNDTIDGGIGTDYLLGGAADDRLYGREDADVLLGDNGQIDFTNRRVSQVMTTNGTIGGNDTLEGNEAEDLLLGGTGNDRIAGNAGADLILGDNGRMQFSDGVLQRIETTDPSNGGNDSITGDGNADIVLGGTGNDTISGGDDDAVDILLGDNGLVVGADGSVLANDIVSTDPDWGGSDSITGGDGADIIIGGSGGSDRTGVGGDWLDGGNDDDIIMGDSARIQRTATNQIETITTLFPDQGGDDTVRGGQGDDIALGGFGRDSMTGAEGADILLGDNGQLDYTLDGNLATLDRITSTDPDLGGNDTLSGGSEDDTVLGGVGDDAIAGQTGEDILLGDNGQILFTGGVIRQIATIAPGLGGNDTMTGDQGADIALGGAANDAIAGNAGDDILLGDNGLLDYGLDSDLSTLDIIRTTDSTIGGQDTLDGDTGEDIALGGTAGDVIRGGAQDDRLLGDNGQILLTDNQIRRIETTDPGVGGRDTIAGNDGDDVIVGGYAGDVLQGNRGEDYVLGDNGRLDYAYAGDGSVGADTNLATLDFVTTTDPTLGGDDLIMGGLGNDTLIGGTGSDRMYGDDGIDPLDGAWRIAATADFNGDGEVDLLWRNGQTGQNLLWWMDRGIPVGLEVLPDVEAGWVVGGVADFDGDGKADMFWRHTLSGSNGLWRMDGTQILGVVALPTVAGASWQIGGIADLNGNGKVDILWRNTESGNNGIWLMDGLAVTAIAALPAVDGAHWKIISVADFNNDAKPDLVWQNQLTGSVGLWLMDGVLFSTIAALPNAPSPAWVLGPTADFNGDGIADLIWHQPVTGSVGLWFLNSSYGIADLTALTDTGTPSSATWDVAGLADFNGDGVIDLLRRNAATGQTAIGIMGVDQVQQQELLLPTVDASWQVAGVGDFNGDGKADIFWRHLTTGNNGLWLMDQTNVNAIAGLPTVPGAEWGVAGVADLNGDGKADILWRNTESGSNGIWLMDGVLISSVVALPTVFGRQWVIGGLADVNGDGKADIVWRNTEADTNGVWLMNRTEFSTIAGLPPGPGRQWTLQGSGDLNGDGQTDLVWKNQTNHQLAFWLLNGSSLQQTKSLRSGYEANDVMFGDHAKVYPALPQWQNAIAIDTGATAGGGNDRMYGNQGDDWMLGQQGNDWMAGQAGEDDMLGGHNVVGGADGSDDMDGGADPDVMLGDNGTILRRLLGDHLWQRYPAPFDAVIRDITRFDDRDRIGGNDTMQGGSGDDILHGQRGDDQMAGNAGDDELFGELGNDAMSGGDGHDTMLGDTGLITRAYQADGAPRLNANGSWHRDVILTDVGRLSASYNGSLPDANLLQTSDRLLVTGAYQADGSRVLDGGVWRTDLHLIDLFADGNDSMQGDNGDDAVFGQRGNDTMGGGQGTDYLQGNAGDDTLNGDAGDDVVIGDDGSTLTPLSLDIPQVTRGLHLIEAHLGSSIQLGPDGMILLPDAQVLPQPVFGLLPTLSVEALLSRDHSPLPPIGPLTTTDGTVLRPLLSVVPTVTGHLDLLQGNDVLSGGAGRDLVVGDTYTRMLPLRTGLAAVDQSLDQMQQALYSLVFNLHDLEMALTSGDPAQTLTLGGDQIDGGDDNDAIIGDNHLFYGPLQFSASLSASLTPWLTDLREAATRLDGIVNTLIAPFGSVTTQPYTLAIGNDAIAGGTGADDITGDDQLVLAPMLQTLPYEKGSFWNYSIPPVTRPARANWRDMNLTLGQDQVSGGGGDDLITGDYNMVLAPVVTAPPTDATTLQTSLDLLVQDSNTFLRDLHQNTYGLDFTTRNQSRTLLAGNDALGGDDDQDLIIGDTSTFVLPFLNGLLNLSINLTKGNFDTSEEAHNFFHALPHQYDVIYRNPATGLTRLAEDTLAGGNGNDILFGLRAIDQLLGQAGDDYLFGGPEADNLDGGTGSNVVRSTNPSPSDLVAIADPVLAHLAQVLDPATRQYLGQLANHPDFLSPTGRILASWPG